MKGIKILKQNKRTILCKWHNINYKIKWNGGCLQSYVCCAVFLEAIWVFDSGVLVNGEGWDCTGMGDDTKVRDCFQLDRSKLGRTGVFEILIVLVGVCSEDNVGDWVGVCSEDTVGDCVAVFDGDSVKEEDSITTSREQLSLFIVQSGAFCGGFDVEGVDSTLDFRWNL